MTALLIIGKILLIIGKIGLVALGLACLVKAFIHACYYSATLKKEDIWK